MSGENGFACLGELMMKNFKDRLATATARWKKSERGAAAVEFALVAAPFVFVLGSLVETGLMMFVEHSLQAGVQNSARLVRTGQVKAKNLDAAAFKAEICKTAGILIDCTGGVTVYVNSAATFSALAASLPSFLNVGPTAANPTPPTVYAPGTTSQPAAVVATYDWKFSMYGMSAFGNVAGGDSRRLVGFSIFQNEPF
jgi:Flp pilus assembly protein TadG